MTKTFCLLGVLLLLVSVGPALADSISPATVALNIPNIGNSETIHKTVHVDAGPPTTSKVDVFFLADTTGSMGGVIGSVASAATSIMSSVSGLGDVAFGVGEYKDACCGSGSGGPDGDPFTYKLDQAVTSSTAAAQAGINLWVAGGGGDFPESDLFGLNSVATGASGFRAGSARILVWMGDAPSHEPGSCPDGGTCDGFGTVTRETAAANLNAANIKVEAMDVGSLNLYG